MPARKPDSRWLAVLQRLIEEHGGNMAAAEDAVSLKKGTLSRWLKNAEEQTAYQPTPELLAQFGAYTEREYQISARELAEYVGIIPGDGHEEAGEDPVPDVIRGHWLRMRHTLSEEGFEAITAILENQMPMLEGLYRDGKLPPPRRARRRQIRPVEDE